MIHKRAAALTGIILAIVVVVGIVSGGGIDDVDHPNWSGNFLVDRTGTHRAAITSSGALKVDGSGVGTGTEIAHISSALHIAGILPVQVAHISGALHIAGIVAVREHFGSSMVQYQVNACGGTAAVAVVTNTNRRTLILSNIGGAAANSERNIIFIGYGATGHTAVTTGTGIPLAPHYVISGTAVSLGVAATTPPMVLDNYQGPITCITNQNTAILGVIEILR